MPVDPFTDHTPDSAPPGARRSMETTVRRLGYLPAPVGRLAESPEALDGFLRLSGLFEASTLDPLAREVVIMTVAARNACQVCVAMHTGKLTALGADGGLIAALREQRALGDERLEALREFTLAVMDESGAVPDGLFNAFLGRGFTRRNALEVVLGVGAYTLSTYANRMTRAPLDERLAPFAWTA